MLSSRQFWSRKQFTDTETLQNWAQNRRNTDTETFQNWAQNRRNTGTNNRTGHRTCEAQCTVIRTQNWAQSSTTQELSELGTEQVEYCMANM